MMCGMWADVANNHQTQTGRNLVTLGLLIILVGAVLAVTHTPAAPVVIAVGFAIAAVGGFTRKAEPEQGG